VSSQQPEDLRGSPPSRTAAPERPAMARVGRATSNQGYVGGKCFIANSSFDPRLPERRR
jgi:hypothetical protein